MKRLTLKIASVVLLLTVLSFSCFNPHGGSSGGVCDVVSMIGYPVALMVPVGIDALARWNVVDLQNANIFVLLAAGAVIWSLLVGSILAAVWTKVRK